MTNIISFQKPGITRITAAFFAAFALCDIGSIHPADIFSALIFAGMLLLFSPTLTQRLTNIGAASSVLPCHFIQYADFAVLYTLFYAAASTLNCPALTAAYSGLHSWRLRLSVCILYSSDSVNCPCCFLHPDSSGVLPKNTLQQPDGARPVPPSHICSACPVPQTEAALLLRFCSSAGCSGFCTSFPVFLTPDSISQFSQATGLIPFSNHPRSCTLLFSLFYHIGFFLTGSINTGIACYVLFQMCTMAAIETYTLSLLARSGASRLWLILSFFVSGGLVPFHAIFAVTVWKDILFPDLCCYIFVFI